MKKGLLGLIATFSLSGVLASCAFDGGNGKKPVDAGFIREITKISLLTKTGQENRQALERFVNSFKKVEPNVEVEIQSFSGNDSQLGEKVLTSISSNQHPDLAMIYPDVVANCIDYGVTYDLEPYIHDEKYGLTDDEYADYVESYLDEGRNFIIPGTYCMPINESTELVYYNKDKVIGAIFDDTVNNGNPITQSYLENLTWEEFFEVLCPAISTYLESHETYLDTTEPEWSILGIDSDANLFIQLAEQYGFGYTSIVNEEGHVDFVNDEAKALLKKLNGYAKLHYINSQGVTNNNSSTYFKANQCLFSIGSTAGAKYQYDDSTKPDIGVFPIPHAKDGGNGVISQGPSMAFLSHKNSDGKVDENRKLASWLFYKHMTNPENNLDWSTTTGYFPIRTSVYENEEYKAIINEKNYTENTFDILIARIAKEMEFVKDKLFVSPCFKGSSECRDAVNALVANALTRDNDATDDNINAWFKTAYDAAMKGIK